MWHAGERVAQRISLARSNDVRKTLPPTPHAIGEPRVSLSNPPMKPGKVPAVTAPDLGPTVEMNVAP
jgi:hypothetical protein